MTGEPKFIVIDTETTGLFDFKQPADADGQPRLAAAAFILADESGEEISAVKHFIKPDGWEMPDEAFRINGISTEFLDQNGVPVVTVLEEYEGYIRNGLIVIAFNAQFDSKVMRAEMRRAGRDDLFETTPNICMMRSLSPYGKEGMPIMRGFIKLVEACGWFGFALDEAHDALHDARAARQILARLIADGRLPDAKVHYARNPPVKAAAPEAAE